MLGGSDDHSQYPFVFVTSPDGAESATRDTEGWKILRFTRKVHQKTRKDHQTHIN